MQTSSIVQLSTVVGWLTKKYKKVILKFFSYRTEILQEAREVKELQIKKFVIFGVHFDQFTVILLCKKSYKKERKQIIPVKTF